MSEGEDSYEDSQASRDPLEDLLERYNVSFQPVYTFKVRKRSVLTLNLAVAYCLQTCQRTLIFC